MADAYDANTPLDSAKAREGAAELRAIKARMDAMGSVNPSSLFAFRNRAINPQFFIDQVNEGGNYAASGSDVDGWGFNITGTGGVTRKREADGNGNFYRKCTITTADASIAATDRYESVTVVEGTYCRDFNQGLASATGFTISFDYYSSAAGQILALSVQNPGRTSSYVTTFNTVAANTWERKVIQVPGDATGTWPKDTSIGLLVNFDMGSGANFLTPAANSWQAGNYCTIAGVSNPIQTLSQEHRIRNFQIEKGNILSPVTELIPVDMQLLYCQRYLEKSYDQGTAIGSAVAASGVTGVTGTGAINAVVLYGVYRAPKRATPAVTIYSTAGVINRMSDAIGSSATLSMSTLSGKNSFVAVNSQVLNANTYASGHFVADSRLV